MIKEYIITKAFDELIGVVKSFSRSSNPKKLLIDRRGLEAALEDHMNFIKNWASEISFRDLQNSKDLNDTYIGLDLYLSPKKTNIIASSSKISFDELVSRMSKNIVILGHPGAGKTTSMKFVCNGLLYDENFLKGIASIPILIRLRDLQLVETFEQNKTQKQIESIFFHIYELLGIQIEIGSKSEANMITKANYKVHDKLIQRVVTSLLKELNVLLILDGLDEVTSTQKNTLVEEIKSLSLRLTNSKFILTCRTGEYGHNIENANEFEICQLTNNQIRAFIDKWVKDKVKSSKLYGEVLASPYTDTLAKPLTLAHLCAIYERYGRIPEKPRTLYKKIVTLLIEEWDSQRGVERLSKYSNFDTDRKFDFLCHLAYYLTTELQKVTFTTLQFQKAYSAICNHFNLPSGEFEEVANEIEANTGLFLQTGYEEFEFVHKSLQEYLTAEYIVRLPQIPFQRYLLLKIPNELALAVSISSNPTTYFSSLFLVNFHLTLGIAEEFIQTFFSRLLAEKPDFIIDPLLGLATLIVAEKLKNYLALKEFETFCSLPEIKDSIALVMDNYEIEVTEVVKDKMVSTIVNTNYFNNDILTCLPNHITLETKFLSC